MEKAFGFPVVSSHNIFEVIKELGVQPWPHTRPPMPLEEYVKSDLTETQRSELRFAPQNEAVFLSDPSGKPYTGFRGRGKDWATVFTFLPGKLIPLVFEFKHGVGAVTIVPPSGVPNKDEMKIVDSVSRMVLVGQREFEEEFGVVLHSVMPLTNVGLPVTSRQRTDRFFPLLGFVKEPLERKPAKLDATEHLKGVLIPLDEWLKLLERGRFPDWCVIDDCAGTITLLALLRLGII